MTEHIQINPVTPRVAYMADGVQSAFTYPFAIFTPNDIEVWLGDARQSSGFSVSGAGISTGGAVLFAVPPAAGSRVTLRRRLAIARTSDFQADGVIRAKTLNDEFDIQTAALQQVADDTARAVVRAVTSGSTADLTLPEPAPGQAIGWNADGSALTNDPGGLQGLAVNVAQQAAAATAAAQAAAASAAQASGDMRGANNLSDLADTATARTNLGAAAANHGHVAADLADLATAVQAVIDQQPGSAIDARLAFLELNLAVNTLRDQIDAGWSVLKMVDGIADEFEDTSGIGSSDGTYDTSGDYIHNPGTAGTTVTLTATALGGSAANGTMADTVDGSTAVEFGWMGAAYAGKYIRYDAGSSVSAVKLRQYTSTAATCVAGWELYGANQSDYSDKTLAASSSTAGAFANADGWQEKTFPASAAYRYWEFAPSSGTNGINPANQPHLIEFELWQAAGAPADITLVSTATAAMAGTTETEARIVLLHQPIDAVTLNTDVTVEVSRDNGTSWTAGTLTHQGAFDATTNILTATIGLSAQPAGTTMKWRVKTFNAKHQRLHGVWMQWR